MDPHSGKRSGKPTGHRGRDSSALSDTLNATGCDDAVQDPAVLSAPVLLASPFRLDHLGCRVGRDHARGAQRVLPHCVNDARAQGTAGPADAAAHDAAVEIEALVGNMLVEAIERNTGPR